MKYVPIILSGLIFIIGVNTLLAIRDSKMWNQLEQRQHQYEELLK